MGDPPVRVVIMPSMKRFLVVGLILAGCVTTEQLPMSAREHAVVIETGRSKYTSYRIANEWIVDTFKSAEGFIQYQDLGETNGRTRLDAVIKGRTNQTFVMEDAFDVITVEFVLTLELRDGRTRVTFDNVTTEAAASVWDLNFYTEAVHAKFVAFADLLVDNLEVAMKKDRRW